MVFGLSVLLLGLADLVPQPVGVARARMLMNPATMCLTCRRRGQLTRKLGPAGRAAANAYLVWGTLTALPKNGSEPFQASYVLYQAVTEVVRWTLTGWLYGLLLPMLPGRVGPVKALWLSGEWFAASAPVAIVDVWTGADPGRVWLFPGLQLLLFTTALAVLMDLPTVRAWAGGRLPLAANWSTLLKVYNYEDARKVAVYAIPAILAVIVIAQQLISGTGLDFVSSLLSGAQSLLGGR